MTSIVKSGVKQWLLQRICNVVIVLYSILLIGLTLSTPLDTFTAISALLAQSWFKLISTICIFIFAVNSILAGWQIAGDYVKGVVINKIFNGLSILFTAAGLLVALIILWR